MHLQCASMAALVGAALTLVRISAIPDTRFSVMADSVST
jgi:hypothetical protein